MKTNMQENKLILCAHCRKKTSYHICRRPEQVVVNGTKVEAEVYYGICDTCGSELFVPSLDDRNEERIEIYYRKVNGLITKSEIEKILDKYNIEKRPLSKLLGLGEITLTRYIDGQFPSKKYSDLLLDVLENEESMEKYVEKNRDKVSGVTIEKVQKAIEKCKEEKKISGDADRFALYIINHGRDITNLYLQKLLYYVKGISEIVYGKSMIADSCEAWKYGPVFPKVYERYKEYKKDEISLSVSKKYTEGLLSDAEKKVTKLVLDSFGKYSAWFLMELTHHENPWREARGALTEDDACRNVMDDGLISSYFIEMNKKFDLSCPKGISEYIESME